MALTTRERMLNSMRKRILIWLAFCVLPGIGAFAAAVSSVSVPSAGTYVAGMNLDFTVVYDSAITVSTTGGTPYVNLVIGSTTVDASYLTGSGTRSLIFRYTVVSGMTDSDGIGVGSAIVANGGSLLDASTNSSADLSLNTVASTSGVFVDSAAPTLTSVVIASGNADKTVAAAGDTITLSLTASEGIASPTVTIAGGSASVNDAGDSDAATWQATYTLPSGTALGTVSFSIAFRDLAGNAGTTVRSTTDGNSVSCVARAAVSSVAVPAAGTYIAGQNLDFTVVYGSALDVTRSGGTPYIALSLDSGTVQAAYVSGSGTTSLVFRYTVVSGDIDTDGVTVGSSIVANGGKLKDSYGIDADLTLNNAASTSGVLADAVAPTIKSLGIASGNADKAVAQAGDQITLSLTASEGIASPTVTIAGGSASVNDAGDSDAATWQATYTLPSGTALGTVSFSVAFRDLAGNAGTSVSATTDGSAVTWVAEGTSITIVRPSNGASLDINSGSMVVAKLIDADSGIDSDSIVLSIDDVEVEPTALVSVSGGYMLYYLLATIDYSTSASHSLVLTADNKDGVQSSASATFTLKPERSGIGFGRFKF
jgi:hypothetical protein